MQANKQKEIQLNSIGQDLEDNDDADAKTAGMLTQVSERLCVPACFTHMVLSALLFFEAVTTCSCNIVCIS